MAGNRTDFVPHPDVFSGWNLAYDLNKLARIIDPTRRVDLEAVDQSIPACGVSTDSLLTGKKLVSGTLQEAPGGSEKQGQSRPVGQVSAIRIPVRAPGRRRHWLLWLTVSAVTVLGLAVFAWLVVKKSDFTQVEVFEGRASGDVQLSINPGEPLPAFGGYLLVEDPNRWGDAFSEQDLVGKNTVLFVWGSWNHELLSWSQDLNYIRLVDLEGANLQFVGLNLDRSKEAALLEFNEDMSGWPHIFNYDERQEISRSPMDVLGIQQSPLILLVDASGRLRAKGLTPAELVEACRKLFD